jgi:hypothetical protein
MNGDYGTRVFVCAIQPRRRRRRRRRKDNDRFYEVNPLLDSQPGGKINTEPSSSSFLFIPIPLNRQDRERYL